MIDHHRCGCEGLVIMSSIVVTSIVMSGFVLSSVVWAIIVVSSIILTRVVGVVVMVQLRNVMCILGSLGYRHYKLQIRKKVRVKYICIIELAICMKIISPSSFIKYLVTTRQQSQVKALLLQFSRISVVWSRCIKRERKKCWHDDLMIDPSHEPNNYVRKLAMISSLAVLQLGDWFRLRRKFNEEVNFRRGALVTHTEGRYFELTSRKFSPLRALKS